ncbi:MAG TPA: ACT domain-containing protein [Methanomassiliicoccales archaeon]|nr:ACT domain-containing protein [Methanomassiliicoccales archaeon]
MIQFWMDQPPLFVHRLSRGELFEGPRFATVDEGDEATVISSKAGEGAVGPYVCITMGPFDLGLIGILARASAALMEEKVPIFVISTYRHDHILIPLEMTRNAIKALTDAGFSKRK